VVGERVRELRSERPDLAANAAEVVEQPRALARQLRKELGEAQDVDGAILDLAPIAFWQEVTHSETSPCAPNAEIGGSCGGQSDAPR
jgi:hypothetical protein